MTFSWNMATVRRMPFMSFIIILKVWRSVFLRMRTASRSGGRLDIVHRQSFVRDRISIELSRWTKKSLGFPSQYFQVDVPAFPFYLEKYSSPVYLVFGYDIDFVFTFAVPPASDAFMLFRNGGFRNSRFFSAKIMMIFRMTKNLISFLPRFQCVCEKICLHLDDFS